MSDLLTRGFRAQLTSSMDSVLRRAVFEIMLIFENSLYDHQRELAQKGEEIAQLKIKLQRAEIKLTERESGDKEAALNKTQTLVNKTQKEPVDPPGQTSDVPEIDFEVPDDWCAPLGCENMTKQEYGMCPSVKLRKLSIPLWPISIIKQEVVNRDIDSRQQIKCLRRSRRGSSLKERHKQTEDRNLPMHGQRTRRSSVRNDMKKLLQDIKQEYTDQTGGIGLRRQRNLIGKEQVNTTKSKKEERKLAAPESTGKETVKNEDENKYCCKFCKKVFDTEFGRSVHVRSHKRCRGCKKEFPFPSALRCHKPSCKKLKKLLAKEAQSTNPPKPESCGEEKPTAPSKKQVIVRKASKPSSSNHSESSIQKDRSTKKHSCVHCKKTFDKRWALKEHFRIHTGERPFPCSMCPKKFRVNQSLKKHVMRIHKDHTNSCETNGNLAWTKPLEETEDGQEDSMSPRKDKSRAISHNNVQRDSSPDTKLSSWQTMGTRCPKGFMCVLCQKVSTNKYGLIEHFRTHTGEKPIKCDRCPEMFRFRGQLSIHKKKCHKTIMVAQCTKCEKKFFSQTRYKKHVSHCHRDKPNCCKVCGKAFFTKGRLRNHMELLHH